jgi:hypothetical protein
VRAKVAADKVPKASFIIIFLRCFLGEANQLLDKQSNSRMLRKNPFTDVEAVSRRSTFFKCALVDLGI